MSPRVHLRRDPKERFLEKVAMVARGGRTHWLWKTKTRSFRLHPAGLCGEARRASMLLFGGEEVPPDKVVFACVYDDRCVAPWCLTLGSAAQLARRNREANGRLVGERAPGAKLTEKQVLAIRSRFDAGETGVSLASEFRLSVPGIYAAVKGRTWTYLPLGKSAGMDCRNRRCP